MQPLAQAALRSIQEFHGNDKAATMPWLDQVELVAERTGNNPVEVGISKLKGLALGDSNTIRKGEGLTWHRCRQILIENYSNIQYVSDVMVAYTNLTQQDNKSTSQYLIRAKVSLECMNHTSKLSQISGKELNSLSLIQGLRDYHIRWRVAKEQESWITIEDIYRSISRITKTDAHMKTLHEPRYNSISEVMTEGINEVSYNKGKRQYSYDKSHNSSNFRKQNNGSPHKRYQGNSHSYQTPIKVKCYYHDGKHCIDDCKKFKKDKDKYNPSRADITKKYKERLLKNAKRSSIAINKAALSSKPQESTYSIGQAALIRGMHLSDIGSDSN